MHHAFFILRTLSVATSHQLQRVTCRRLTNDGKRDIDVCEKIGVCSQQDARVCVGVIAAEDVPGRCRTVQHGSTDPTVIRQRYRTRPRSLHHRSQCIPSRHEVKVFADRTLQHIGFARGISAWPCILTEAMPDRLDGVSRDDRFDVAQRRWHESVIVTEVGNPFATRRSQTAHPVRSHRERRVTAHVADLRRIDRLHDGACFGRGGVVRDNHFEAVMILIEDRGERVRQRVRPLPGRHDDAETGTTHGRDSAARSSSQRDGPPRKQRGERHEMTFRGN